MRTVRIYHLILFFAPELNSGAGIIYWKVIKMTVPIRIITLLLEQKPVSSETSILFYPLPELNSGSGILVLYKQQIKRICIK